MRTDNPSPPAPVLSRLRAQADRARRRFEAQPTAFRWSLGLAALAALAALAYAANGPANPEAGYVRSGEAFSSDDLIDVRRTLDAEHVAYRVEGHRVRVNADRLDAANVALAKLNPGAPSLREIERQARQTSVFDTLLDRQGRKEWADSATLGALIRRVGDFVDARVWLHRPRARGFSRTAAAATAFVYVETRDEHRLDGVTVEKIRGMIAGAEPDVKPDGVSVFDQFGNRYLDAHDPAVGAEVRHRARAEELRREIVEQLNWVSGAQVSVNLVAAPAENGTGRHAAGEVSALPPSSRDSAAPTTRTAAPPAPLPAPAPAVVANVPLELAPEEPTPVPTPAPPVPAVAPAPAVPTPPRVRVWVKVPRSFYLKAVARREPNFDDLQPLMERNKGLIETAVRHVVPKGQLEEPVQISMIPDVPVEATEPVTPAGSPRPVPWWVPAAVAGASTAVVLAVGFAVLAARRPSFTPPPRAGGGRSRYKIDEPDDTGAGPGASERVRELVRLSPEAAASVLHRWTGQGGTVG